MDKTIRLSCDVRDSLPLDMLNPFQGSLKDLEKEDYNRLRKEILDTGFAFPVHVWWFETEQRWCIVGGHQRVRVIRELRDAEGFTIPQVPIVKVLAGSYSEAKRRVLQDASQYGKVNRDGLYEFSLDAGINLKDLTESFRLPDMDMGSFGQEFFSDSELSNPDAPESIPPVVGSKELNEDDFQEFEKKCPRCGFEFDA